MLGWEINWEEIAAGSPKTKFTTPLGTPASANASMSSELEAGVSSAALTTIEQPAASAAESFLVICCTGKFQGAKAATGPTGSLTTSWYTSGRRGGITRP